MGNCICRRRTSEDHWASFSSHHQAPAPGNSHGTHVQDRSSGVTGASKSEVLPSSSPAGTYQVKIRISRKELEELLNKADGLSVDQVVAHLINGGDRFTSHQRPWRPALQSIPE